MYILPESQKYWVDCGSKRSACKYWPQENVGIDFFPLHPIFLTEKHTYNMSGIWKLVEKKVGNFCKEQCSLLEWKICFFFKLFVFIVVFFKTNKSP